MKLIFQWNEGREVRSIETEIDGLSWPDITEYIRQALKKTIKYSDAPIPEGLLKEENGIKELL